MGAAGFVPLTGDGGSKGKKLMRNAVRSAMVVWLLLATAGGLYARQNIVRNGSMEAGPGPGGEDPHKALDWVFFGGTTVERSDEANNTPDGAWALKVFGGESVVGAYQDVEALPGDSVAIAALLYTRGMDQIGGDAKAKIKLDFVDADGEAIGEGTELIVLDGSATPEVWTPGSIGPLTAPAGTVAARMVCVWTFVDESFGSAFWDDCELTINGGANMLSNGDFEIPGTSGDTPFGIDYWTGFGGQWKSDEVAWHGGYSANVAVGGDTGAAYSGLYQDTVELGAGDHLFLQCQVFNPSLGGLDQNAAAAIKLEFFPGNGGDVPPPEEALDFDENAPQDTWELVSYQTVVPENVTLARIVLIASDETDENGPVYFDSALAERGSQPGSNQLSNASFEQGTSGPNGLTDWTEFRGFDCMARKNAFEVDAHDGFSVLKISGSCTAGIYQDVEVTPGETLTISSYMRTDSADPFNHPDSVAGVKVEWRAGNVPPGIDIGGAENNTLLAGEGVDEWTPLSIDYTMPAGSAALVRYTLIVARGSATEAQVFFDACEAIVTNIFDGADADADNDQDLLDFALFQQCYSGAGVVSDGWPSMVFDSDDDEDVDFDDFEFFAPRFTGP